MNLIIDDRCTCLDSKCYKRKFSFIDPFGSSNYYDYNVCNDLIRLKLHEVTMHDKYKYFINKLYLEQIIIELLSEHKNVYNCQVWNDKNIVKANDISINFTFCERPFIRRSIKLNNALLMYKENRMSNNGMYLIIDALTDFYNNQTNSNSVYFSKSKIIGKDKFKKILKKVKESWFTEEKEIALNELILFVLETKIKSK